MIYTVQYEINKAPVHKIFTSAVQTTVGPVALLSSYKKLTSHCISFSSVVEYGIYDAKSVSLEVSSRTLVFSPSFFL
jgi:hypothetical protein